MIKCVSEQTSVTATATAAASSILAAAAVEMATLWPTAVAQK